MDQPPIAPAWTGPAETAYIALRASLTTASTDGTRAHLAGVWIEPAERTLRLVSTDGHRLSVIAIGREAPGTEAPGFLVGRSSVAAALGALRALPVRTRRETMVAITLAGPVATLAGVSGAYIGPIGAPLTGPSGHRHQPIPWTKVAPPITEAGVPVAVNPRYMGDAMAQAAALGCPWIAIRPGAGALDPVRLDAWNGETDAASVRLLAVLMPMRTDSRARPSDPLPPPGGDL